MDRGLKIPTISLHFLKNVKKWLGLVYIENHNFRELINQIQKHLCWYSNFGLYQPSI